jgi:hypothetical protein
MPSHHSQSKVILLQTLAHVPLSHTHLQHYSHVMADEGDFYEVLGIVRGCKETEVRRGRCVT